MPKTNNNPLPPVFLALVMADEVRRDPATGKHTILGTFDSIFGARFPCPYPGLSVYFVLTNGHGETPVTLRLVDVDEAREPVFTWGATLPLTKPTMTAELACRFERVIFPAPGSYRLQLSAAGNLLAERRLRVRPVPHLQVTEDADS